MKRVVTLALALATVGCGKDGAPLTDIPDAGGADSGVTIPDGGIEPPPGPLDLLNGTWTVESVSQSPQNISHTPALTVTPDGTLWSAWVEADEVNSFDEDIWVGRDGTGGAPWSIEPSAQGTDMQYAYPSIASVGSQLHLVFNGYPSIDQDIFYRRFDGSGWSAQLDLTSPDELTDGALRQDYAARVATGPSGEVAVAYLSRPANSNGTPTGPGDIRVMFLRAGFPEGRYQTALDSATWGPCFKPALAFDPQGLVHLVADCGPGGGEDLIYATNASGSWVATRLDGTEQEDDYDAQLQVDADGSVHVVWTGFPDCEGSSGTCPEVLYRVKRQGTWSGPISASQNPTGRDQRASLAVDPEGRALVGFERTDASNMKDVFFTFTETGASFTAPRNLTPNSETRDDDQAIAMVVDPVTGAPHLLFTSVLSVSPLNVEVQHAAYAPP